MVPMPSQPLPTNPGPTHPGGRVLPTLEADGSRRWLFPRLARGALWKARRWTAYGLIAVFTLVPFLRVGGRPLILIDVAGRQLTLLGQTFLPRDAFFLALLVLAWLLTIFLFTALLGRAWCGWACPQTVYMEFLFRPIERLFLGRRGAGGRPANGLSAFRYLTMYAAFLLASCYLAHAFLSYFVGVDQLRTWVTQSPFAHPWPFAVMAGSTAAVMFNFAYFREQMCLIACPYGRFQSVLLDRDSLVVRYDRPRGEPRGRRASTRASLPILGAAAAQDPGDCVDCTMCVQVCPTGTDIRDGLQFECVNCAQCIDACNAVMSRVGRPPGLVRYASLNALERRPGRVVRPRVLLYAAATAGVLAVLITLLAIRKPMDVLLVRNVGLPFVIAPDGQVENTMRVQLTNRMDARATFRIGIAGNSGARVAEANEDVVLEPRQTVQRAIHLLAPPAAFEFGRCGAVVRVTGPGGTFVDRGCQLFGPVVPGTAQPARGGQP